MNKITNGKMAICKGPLAVYLLIVASSIWFLISYDRQFGFAFITALVLMPIASFLATFFAVSKIQAGIDLSSSMLNKGEDVRMTLTVKSGGWLPIPFLNVKLDNEWRLSEDGGLQYLLSVSSTRPGIIKKNYKAETWGTASLGVSSIAVYDYLGLFKITYTSRDCIVPASSVSIRPSLRESLKNDYLAYLCNKMMCEEERDEDGQSVKQSFITQPGYEHRPYVPGDPLKRINWKLSARLDKYMVREYEYLTHPAPVIILDRCGIRHKMQHEWQRKAVLLEERVVEAVLAMLGSMVRQEMVCKVYFFLEGAWQMLTIENIDHVEVLRQKLSKYVFENIDGQRMPDGDFARSGAIAMFTGALDDALIGEMSGAAGGGSPINVICPEMPEQITGNLWLVNESYDFITM